MTGHRPGSPSPPFRFVALFAAVLGLAFAVVGGRPWTPAQGSPPSPTGGPTRLYTPLVELRQSESPAGACGLAPTPPAADPAPGRAAAVAHLADVRLVSYYPARSAWSNMWSRWDAATIDADFARIAGMGANAVRIVAHVDAFGYPTPSPSALDELTRTVDLAAGHGLEVHLTLFDWWSSYCDLAGSKHWAGAVLAPFRDDPRIAAIELQNEMDTANPDAIAWAQRTVPFVRDLMGTTPVSISVSGAAGVPGLERLVASGIPLDYYDLHYYGPAPLAYEELQRARAVVGGAPLFVGETGYSTHPADEPGAAPYGEEAYQDQYLRTVEHATQALGLPLAAPWVFSDFAPGAVPPGEWASKASQYAYGLFRTDGTPKPAAGSIARIFSQGTVDLSFNNGFEEIGAPGMPANWRVWLPSDGQFARDAGVAHSGTASVRISQSRAEPGGVASFYVSPVTHVAPGQTYTASAWAEGSAASGANRVALAWFDRNGTYLTTSHSPELPPGDTPWTQLSVSAPAPSAAAFVEIHLQSAANPGSVWFDDVAFD